MKAGGELALEGDELGLSNFSLSQAKSQTGAADAATFENSKDIVIDNFSISAHKKQLFENASLRISHGRRWVFLID